MLPLPDGQCDPSSTRILRSKDRTNYATSNVRLSVPTPQQLGYHQRLALRHLPYVVRPLDSDAMKRTCLALFVAIMIDYPLEPAINSYGIKAGSSPAVS